MRVWESYEVGEAPILFRLGGQGKCFCEAVIDQELNKVKKLSHVGKRQEYCRQM